MIGIASIDDIAALYAARGGLHYGEDVTQIEHALQCAILAETTGAAPALIIAALLHDIGHLVIDPEDLSDVDHRHESIGAETLRNLFGAAVFQPVALHVAAKRYLCFSEPSYRTELSAASQHSLLLQGGPFDRAQAEAFEHLPFWREAVALRRFDDMGKHDDSARRSFADFVPMMRRLSIERRGG